MLNIEIIQYKVVQSSVYTVIVICRKTRHRDVTPAQVFHTRDTSIIQTEACTMEPILTIVWNFRADQKAECGELNQRCLLQYYKHYSVAR